MKALVSGQAGLAVVLGDAPEFRPVRADPRPASEEEIFRSLEGFSDVQEVIVPDGDVQQLDIIASQAWAKDQAIYQLYMLFDMDGSNLKLQDSIAKRFQLIISEYKITEDVRKWLSDVDLGSKHIDRAKELATRYDALKFVASQLYPGLDQRDTSTEKLKKEEKKIKNHKYKYTQKQPNKRSNINRHVDDRPNSLEEQEALRVLMSIINQARPSFVGARESRFNFKSNKNNLISKNHGYHSLRFIQRLTFFINQTLYRKGFRNIRPYTFREVSKLVRRRAIIRVTYDDNSHTERKYSQYR